MRTVTLKNVTVTEEELREALRQVEAQPSPPQKAEHMDVCVRDGKALWLMLDAKKLRRHLHACGTRPFVALHKHGGLGCDNGEAEDGYTYAPGTLTLGVKS